MDKEDNKKEVEIPQKFYFNNQEKLIVESNKGVWADGEQFVKMYGIFTCNAKTMGKIIHKITGTPVEIGVEEIVRVSQDEVVDELLNVNQHTIQHYCVLGASEERVNEYEKELAKSKYSITNDKRLEARLNNMSVQNDDLKKEKLELRELLAKNNAAIHDFNNLPWWKRLFKKIEVK